MWGFVRCLRKDTLSGQKQQATHAASSTKKAYWKDTGSYQRNKVQQGYSSLIRNGKLSSTAVFSAWLSFWTPLLLPLCSSLSCVLFKQFRSAFPKAQPQPPAQVCMPYSPEPITIELTQSRQSIPNTWKRHSYWAVQLGKVFYFCLYPTPTYISHQDGGK